MLDQILAELPFETDTSAALREGVAKGIVPPPRLISRLLADREAIATYGKAPDPGFYDITGVLCGVKHNQWRGSFYAWLRCRNVEGKNWYGKIAVRDSACFEKPPKNGDIMRNVWYVCPYTHSPRPEFVQLRPIPGWILDDDIPSTPTLPRLSCEASALAPGSTRRDREHRPPVLSSSSERVRRLTQMLSKKEAD